MIENLSPSIQDYLKAIYDLTSHQETATTTALAAHLGVTPASITGMIKKLACSSPTMIVYQKHHGVKLTEFGEKAALEVIRHHRLLETYLYQVLGFEWEQVHEEACRLEHVISETFEAKIDEMLGHPERDPHGDPIPNANLIMPADHSLPLSTLTEAIRVVVRRIRHDDPALLRHLEQIHITPGTELDILQYSRFDQNLHLKITTQSDELILGQAITSQIFVEVLK